MNVFITLSKLEATRNISRSAVYSDKCFYCLHAETISSVYSPKTWNAVVTRDPIYLSEVYRLGEFGAAGETALK